MREIRSQGSVRGVSGNWHSYRDVASLSNVDSKKDQKSPNCSGWLNVDHQGVSRSWRLVGNLRFPIDYTYHGSLLSAKTDGA